ncbi:MAG: ATP-dependent Clp protease adaptor ClpS [Nitrospirae bacterium]|nr:ATP-dependent Clp protease adaptor ClpS [Nitrospirota bacterium]
MPQEAPGTGVLDQADTAFARLYHVVLLDDDDHTYDYVVRMVTTVFGHDTTTAYAHAREVDETGRTILITTTLERAELKQQQVHDFGADPLLERSTGPMRAVLEPA